MTINCIQNWYHWLLIQSSLPDGSTCSTKCFDHILDTVKILIKITAIIQEAALLTYICHINNCSPNIKLLYIILTGRCISFCMRCHMHSFLFSRDSASVSCYKCCLHCAVVCCWSIYYTSDTLVKKFQRINIIIIIIIILCNLYITIFNYWYVILGCFI